MIEDNPSKIEEWHSDMTFQKKSALGSILIGKIIPETGGDTLCSQACLKPMMILLINWKK